MFKDILEAKGITCYRLAKDSGVSYTTVNEVYRGERKIEECSIETGKKLASVLKMSLDKLCEECGKREKITEDLFRCFWDSNPNDLDLLKDKSYIITRLLDKGGYRGFCFLRKAYSYVEIKSVAMQSRNFSPKIASFLKNVCHLRKDQMAYYKTGIKDWRELHAL